MTADFERVSIVRAVIRLTKAQNVWFRLVIGFTSRAISVFPVKFDAEFTTQAVNFSIYYILCVDISVIKPRIKMLSVKWYDIISVSEVISYHFTGLNCPIK